MIPFKRLIILLNLCIFCESLSTFALSEYLNRRGEILSKENSHLLGSSIALNDKEKAVNNYLMRIKLQEFQSALNLSTEFPASKHFFHAKTQIERSEVFKFITKLPKGASLHSHNIGTTSGEFLFNLTYTPDLYVCDYFDKAKNYSTIKLKFFFNKSELRSNTICSWNLLSKVRKDNPKFDAELKAKLTLVVDNPLVKYSTINGVWVEFEKIFDILVDFLSYKPVFEKYFEAALEEMREDNVMYMEFRTFGPPLFQRNRYRLKPEEIIGTYSEIVRKFKRKTRDNFDAKIIYSSNRRIDKQTFKSLIADAINLTASHKDFVVGFDLIGQEDLGETLLHFAPQLLKLAGANVKFFFHAGETNWNGAPHDENLIDAILLNTTRIGHGYSLMKHLEVLKIVKDKDIAVEVSPISNQVLNLVHDLRDHTAAHLISAGYPVVITCDDPGIWGARGLSYDWYYAFMALSPMKGDLRILKQLALNSLKYSGMGDVQKSAAMKVWQRKWNKFLDEILRKQ